MWIMPPAERILEPAATAPEHRERKRLIATGATFAAVVLAFAIFASGREAAAETVRAAVATNFAIPFATVAARFSAATGHQVLTSTGATGSLYAQIEAGAPFDVFLSADAERPEAMERQGLGVAGSRFTYAVGRLALWSSDAKRIAADGKAALAAGDFRALAIADPALAPYGMAARQTLVALGMWDKVAGRIVLGKNIGQAHALVATGNAELGFVALSAIRSSSGTAAGSEWVVPAALHDPIRQDAIRLAGDRSNGAAQALLDYLKSAEAKAVIAANGYGEGD